MLLFAKLLLLNSGLSNSNFNITRVQSQFCINANHNSMSFKIFCAASHIFAIAITKKISIL